MSGFTDRFGGSGLQPSDVAWASYALTGLPQLTYWPFAATPDNVLATHMDVTASGVGQKISMPDATLGSPGATTLFRNMGSYSFIVTDFSGATIYTLTPGQVINIYLTGNTTQAGTWGAFIVGAGVASLDLANSAGNGLFVAGSKLNVTPIASATSSDRIIATADVATAFVWTGGSGTFTLPLSTVIAPFFMEVRNQGSGTLTLATSGGELIDSSTTLALNIGESCFVHAGAGFWFTVGRGRSTLFSFTQLQKNVTGGTTTLTLTEASNVVQTYTGTLTQNEDVVLPSVVQVYYVSNQTTGSFNFRFKTAASGSTVSIPTGQNAVLFSDGTNVINASTTTSGVTSLILAAGSNLSPSIGIGATNTGIFSSASNLVSIASNSTKVADFGPSGLTINAASGLINISPPSGPSILNLIPTAGNYGLIQFYSGANQRFVFGKDNGAETGSNLGSNFVFNCYADSGSFLNTSYTITRSTGVVNFLNGLTGTLTGNVIGSATSAGFATNATNATNAGTATVATQLSGGYTPVSFMTRASANSFTCAWSGSRLYFGIDGNYFGAVMPMDISGQAAYAPQAGNAQQINGIGGWNFTALGGSPNYVWSTNGDGQSQFLCSTAALNVNHAASADSATLAGTANSSNLLLGQAVGYWINNGSTAVINIRNNGVSQYVSALSGFGDVFWGVNISDITLKKNVAPAQVDSTADIDRLEFIEYEFDNDLHELAIDDGSRHTLGISAQQAESVRGEWISNAGKYKQPIEYALLMSTMHSLQAANRRIAALEARLEAMEKAP